MHKCIFKNNHTCHEIKFTLQIKFRTPQTKHQTLSLFFAALRTMTLFKHKKSYHGGKEKVWGDKRR